jgi:hypothetical protein
MSAKHTPGPWRVGEEHRGAISIYARSVDPFDERPMTDRDTFICAVQKGRWIYEQAANTHLIAASPDLFAALQALLAATDYSAGNCHMNARVGAVLDVELIAIARAAIAKAKGIP